MKNQWELSPPGWEEKLLETQTLPSRMEHSYFTEPTWGVHYLVPQLLATPFWHASILQKVLLAALNSKIWGAHSLEKFFAQIQIVIKLCSFGKGTNFSHLEHRAGASHPRSVDLLNPLTYPTTLWPHPVEFSSAQGSEGCTLYISWGSFHPESDERVLGRVTILQGVGHANLPLIKTCAI